KELEQANRNYMQMLGFVTHELKSPLAAMQTMSSVMLEGLAGEVPENVKHFLIRIKKNAEELQDMVKNYLDLSRTEQGEFVADKKEIDLCSEVIDACIAQTKDLFGSRSINLKVNGPEKLMVFADPELMRIAISNYLSNAAKYGKEGGRAELNVSEEDGKIRISVWNEGDGFTQEEGKRLFSKFTRLRNKATQDNRGSGLGLYLCKLVMDQHEGHVWADSQPGEWACFNLSFPKQ
ncbi:MAG: sensor histidine kinase, partial [Candidatus Jordarchaeum sp.]|uniref:sensor histidine kinase n=1 Tax=Candidatus Jordarchaeum sp. TaxID=2823881 RepID=UPI0040493EA8